MFRSKGMGFVRDVLESLARCCLRLNKPEDALRWAVKLHLTSSPSNPDHLGTIQLNVLTYLMML